MFFQRENDMHWLEDWMVTSLWFHFSNLFPQGSFHHLGGGRLFDWIFAEVKKKDPPPPVPPPPPPRWSWDVTEIDGCSERRGLKFFLLKTNYNGKWKSLPSFFSIGTFEIHLHSFEPSFLFFFPAESYVTFQQRVGRVFMFFFFSNLNFRGSVQLETPRDWLKLKPTTTRSASPLGEACWSLSKGQGWKSFQVNMRMFREIGGPGEPSRVGGVLMLAKW